MRRQTEEAIAFRQMTPAKKLDHIWTYYRWFFLVGIAVIAVVISMAQQIAYNSREMLISGSFLNNATSQQGYAHLRDDYIDYCGKPKARVELVEGRMVHFDLEVPPQDEAANLMILVSMISAGSLDYVITDEATVNFFTEQEVALDLSTLLPESTLAALDTVANGKTPIAIRLQDTTFAKEYGFYAEDSCIVIISTSKNLDKVPQFLTYLLTE